MMMTEVITEFDPEVLFRSITSNENLEKFSSGNKEMSIDAFISSTSDFPVILDELPSAAEWRQLLNQ